MARIVFDLDIDARSEAVVEALDTEAGIKGWWTDDAEFTGGIGSEMSLGFPIAPSRFHLKVDGVSPSQVAWRSVGDFPPHWVGTTVIWSLSQATGGQASTSVHFLHDGWVNDEGPFGMSALTWGRLMDRLKVYCETGAVQPLFRRSSGPVGGAA